MYLEAVMQFFLQWKYHKTVKGLNPGVISKNGNTIVLKQIIGDCCSACFLCTISSQLCRVSVSNRY